jgi:hypothetical protein
MAKMKLNAAVDTFSGKLGNMVHRQLWGKHVVSRPPDFSKRVLSSKQLAENTKYKSSSLIWKQLPERVKAAYSAWGRQANKPPYALFNKNCSCSPIVEAIDLSAYRGEAGQPISVHATDLFAVAGVDVTVRGADGEVLETGPATQVEPERDAWVYQSTLTVVDLPELVVEAVASNWPRKQGSRLELLSLNN